MKFKLLLALGMAFIFISTRASAAQNIEELSPLNVLRDHITLSGFSSGGTMAQFLQVSYSSMFQGIAIFSHTFLRCGIPNGIFQDWDRVCTLVDNTTESGWYNTDLVHQDLQNYFAQGLIENLKNLRNKPLYVYTGLRSVLFHPVQALNIIKVFERYIQNPYKIKTRVQDSVFVMPTDNNFGLPCTEDATNRSFIGNCGFSGAYEALKFLYADSYLIRHPKQHRGIFKQPLRSFNQKTFLKGLQNHQMDDVGFFYVPARCQIGTPCLFHVFFHGCATGRNFTGETFIANSGFLEVAEANNIIMLFPQNNPEALLGTLAQGCWDAFGFSGPLYATQRGDQVEAVKRMIQRVLGRFPSINRSQRFIDSPSYSSFFYS